MIDAHSRPELRAVDTVVDRDTQGRTVVVLQDNQAVTKVRAALPVPLYRLVSMFDGRRTCAQISEDATRDFQTDVPVEVVVKVAEQLDEALYLEGARFEAALAAVRQEFASAGIRAATHAGGAYASDPEKLARYIDEKCLANGEAKKGGSIRALIAPHIDPWRGAVGYGHAYATLAEGIAKEADTFIVFGTSHARMREQFALCRKAFDTPFGAVEADTDAIDAIASKATFDPYADELNHMREHSIEFQVVFLRHLMKGRPFRIVPILAGLGEHPVRRTDPAADDTSNRFLDAVSEVVAQRGSRVVVVAGADLAHVGPRFGDRAYEAEAREKLAETDRRSLTKVASGNGLEFWNDITADLTTRRVCGLGPIYSTLRTMPPGLRGELLHYEQTRDADDGSIVSHAAMAFYDRDGATPG
jgi:AmmeMemoRadiSam system protein B